MSSYQFFEIFDDETQVGFDQWLFHEAKHAQLQSPTGWRTFGIEKEHEIVAQVRFHIKKNEARASVKSPFGTIQFVKDLPAEILFSFIQFCEEALQKVGVNTIVLKNPPALYAPFQNEILSVSLLNLGYQITNAELSCLISIRGQFEDQIDKMELRKLKKSIKEQCNTAIVSHQNFKNIFDFILSCRIEKGYNLSMSYEEMVSAVKNYPDHFILFAVKLREEIVAASICVIINKKILYNFYPAHEKKYDHLSPSVLLTKAIYDFCKTNNIDLLDLGTSALDGKPNFGLLDFKLRLGAQLTSKYTFEKKLK